MKFECKKCIVDGQSGLPCELTIKNGKNLKYERPGWKLALRRCPFENDESGKLTGHAPVAKWKRVKKYDSK